MTEWAVAGIVVAVGGFVVSVAVFTAKYLIPLNTTIVELTNAIKSLQKDLSEFIHDNKKSHERIYQMIAENEKHLNEHDILLTKLKTIHEIGGDSVD